MRVGGASAGCVDKVSPPTCANSAQADQCMKTSANETDTDSTVKELLHYAWFHPGLSRDKAAQLVLCSPRWDRDRDRDRDAQPHSQSPYENCGVFLVRQSDTRPGQMVLTFNSLARAKVCSHPYMHTLYRCTCTILVQCIQCRSACSTAKLMSMFAYSLLKKFLFFIFTIGKFILYNLHYYSA